jgi:hypothetical protein
VIARSIDVLVMLAGGLALGWLLTTEFAPPVDRADETVAAAPEPPASPAPALPRAQSAPADCPEVRAPTAPAPAPSARLPDRQPPLPAVYLDLLGPPAATPNAPHPGEIYGRFAREARDEPWALAMEAGIEDWATRVPEHGGLDIDFAECRTRLCVIAGHTPNGDTTALSQLPNEGWWQASTRNDLRIRSMHNDSADFVLFVRRHAN